MSSIKEATIEDRDELIEFGKNEFTRTFGHLYTDKDLQDYLLEGYEVSKYNQWLTNSDFKIFIARSDESNSVVGYVLSGPCTLPLENCGFDHQYASGCREIKRMYIHPSQFGNKLGSTLLNLALDWLSSLGFSDKIYLGVYSENPRAIRFYQKFGFEKIGEYGFVVGEKIDHEFIFHRKLDKC